MLTLPCATERASAAPAEGALRLSVEGQLSNEYIIDSHRLRTASDIFTIALQEFETSETTSSANFFTLGLLTHLEYRLHPLFSIGLRAGIEIAPVHSFSVVDFQFPLLITSGIVITDWFEIRPEIGINISHNTRTLVTAPNLDTGLRLRFADAIDLYGGFIHGTISGFQFALSARLFNIVNEELTPPPNERAQK